MGMVSLYTLMGMYMKDNGSMIKLMGLVHTNMHTEAYTKEIGATICRTATAKKPGPMVRSTKVIIRRE